MKHVTSKQATIDAAKATKILKMLKILPLKEITIIAQDLPVEGPKLRTFKNTLQETGFLKGLSKTAEAIFILLIINYYY